jgi:hypothetical protein
MTLEQQRALAVAAARKAAEEQPISTTRDVAQSFGSGVVRGAAETAMLPVTAKRLAEQGFDWLFDKGEGLVRSAIGAEPVSDATRAEREQLRAGTMSNQMDEAIFGAQDSARGVMKDVLHEPQTTAGEYARTVGEFVAPGAIPSAAARAAPAGAARAAAYAGDFAGNVVAPAVLSESAGQLTEGTDYETLARIAGAVTGNVGNAAMRASHAPERVLRRATSDMTEADWQRALGIQNNTTGIQVTGPEAIAQATGGASGLPNLQRVVEGSLDGRPLTGPFFAQRPAQVDAAVGNVLDQISPQSPQPSTLGPRAAEAAGTVVDRTRQGINAQTRPLYDKASKHVIPPRAASAAPLGPPYNHYQAQIDELDARQVSAEELSRYGVKDKDGLYRRILSTASKEPLKKGETWRGRVGFIDAAKKRQAAGVSPQEELTDPRFQAALERLRANPELAPEYANLPDNSVGVVDAVSKDLFARGEALSNQANPLYGPEVGMRSTAAAGNARDLARDWMRGGSADYDQALTKQTQLRRDVLQPVEEGPIGKVSRAKDTAGAGNAILPQNPATGSAGEAADATRQLVAEDPETITALIRQAIADRYSRASTETMEGAREFAGAKLHKDVAGNPARQEVLDAIMGELPNQNAAVSMDELLDVLQTTGRRKAIGSATAFNESTIDTLGTGSLQNQVFGLVKSLGSSFLTQAGDATRRHALRGNIESLAELFIDPQSVELIRNAINRGARVNFPEAGARSAAQSAPIVYD